MNLPQFFLFLSVVCWTGHWSSAFVVHSRQSSYNLHQTPNQLRSSSLSTESSDESFNSSSKDNDDNDTSLASKILELLPSPSSGQVSSEARSKMNELILRLEALNPTTAPAQSERLNGTWELRYAGGYAPEGALPSPTRQLALFLYSGGYSPGLLALNLAQALPRNLVGETKHFEVSISPEQPRIQARVQVQAPSFLSLVSSSVSSSLSLDFLVQATLDVESEVRFQETYESAVVNGNTIEVPPPAQYSRSLYVTYLDDDILIVRDDSGIPELLFRNEA